jgi:hypothetical protein
MIADSLAILRDVLASIRFNLFVLCGHKELALENASLRHQLAESVANSGHQAAMGV